MLTRKVRMRRKAGLAAVVLTAALAGSLLFGSVGTAASETTPAQTGSQETGQPASGQSETASSETAQSETAQSETQQTEAQPTQEELDASAWAAAVQQPASTTLTPEEGTWIKKGSKWKFQKKNGTYAKSCFLKIEGAWYHFTAKGYVSKGWFKVNGKKYYARKTAAENGVYGDIATGWTVLGKNTYYFAPASNGSNPGVMTTGWKKIKKKIYYFGKNGKLRTGMKTISKKKFFFTQTGGPGVKGAMVTGWYTDGDSRYYFRKTGKLGTIGAAYRNTWKTINKQKYYFSASGTVTAATASRTAFIKQIGELAKADMKTSGILASITIAQAILESSYGTSELALSANNLFGMKASLSGNSWTSTWTGESYAKKTLEYQNGRYVTVTASFRAYTSFAQSIADHSAYLSGATLADGTLRYKGLVGCKKYKKAAKIIKNGGYATDPSYVSKLCSLIKAYKLTKYDK